MRSRGDAGARRVLSTVQIEELTRAHDPRLGELSALLRRTFPDPNSVLELERMREFLSGAIESGSRRFHVLVAREASAVVGGSVFSYVAASNCGFSEYLVVDESIRQRGLGRSLFERRKAVLDADARRCQQPACRGLFIETENPWRMPADVLAAETQDPLERLRVFQHLGFRRVAVAYVQPPLGPGKDAVEYMDLLFCAWSPDVADAVPAEWLFDTVAEIWSAWTPSEAARYMGDLRLRVSSERVALVDPLQPA